MSLCCVLRSSRSVEKLLNELAERLLLALVDEVELRDEGHEVLEARVEVRFGPDAYDLVEVRVVDVRVDPEEAAEDVLDHGLEAAAVRRSFARGEERLLAQQLLHPRHEHVDVLWRRELRWLLKVLVILPQVLELRPRAHLRTGSARAELEDRAVHDTDLVEEVHRCLKVPKS